MDVYEDIVEVRDGDHWYASWLLSRGWRLLGFSSHPAHDHHTQEEKTLFVVGRPKGVSPTGRISSTEWTDFLTQIGFPPSSPPKDGQRKIGFEPPSTRMEEEKVP